MAQPDFFMEGPHNIIVFEAKLTQRKSGLLQIGQLYRPLLREIFKKPVVGILVCKNLVYEPGRHKISGPEEVIDHKAEDIFTWHFLR